MLVVPAVIAVLLAGCTGGQIPQIRAQAGAPTTIGQVEGITVSGLGRVTGKPDVLRVTVGVSVTRPTVQEALDQANTAADGVIGALRDRGVAEADTQTREFSVNPEFRYPPDGSAPTISGYTVRNLVEAKLRDLGQVGDILTAVVQAGGDDARVEGVTFELEDNAAMLEQARAAAFADARAKAEQYAQLAERPLGGLVTVSEATTMPPVPVPFDSRALEAADTAAAVPIEPGQQEIAVTVTATWALG